MKINKIGSGPEENTKLNQNDLEMRNFNFNFNGYGTKWLNRIELTYRLLQTGQNNKNLRLNSKGKIG